jgi:hypothetical protein
MPIILNIFWTFIGSPINSRENITIPTGIDALIIGTYLETSKPDDDERSTLYAIIPTPFTVPAITIISMPLAEGLLRANSFLLIVYPTATRAVTTQIQKVIVEGGNFDIFANDGQSDHVNAHRRERISGFCIAYYL